MGRCDVHHPIVDFRRPASFELPRYFAEASSKSALDMCNECVASVWQRL